MNHYYKMLINETNETYARLSLRDARKFLAGKMTGDEYDLYTYEMSRSRALAICAALRGKSTGLTINSPLSWRVEKQLVAHGLIQNYRVAGPVTIAFCY